MEVHYLQLIDPIPILIELNINCSQDRNQRDPPAAVDHLSEIFHFPLLIGH